MAIEHPRIFLLDGASGAGKSTLALRLGGERADTVYVRRHTTRPRRSAEDDREYEFVTRDEFEAVKAAGGYLESRDYLFDMSYGIPLEALESALAGGRHALALVNLGRVEAARERDGRVVGILVDAPLDVLVERLTGRGSHTSEQIDERVENARTVAKFRDQYDHVVRSDGPLEETVAQLHGIIDSYDS